MARASAVVPLLIVAALVGRAAGQAPAPQGPPAARATFGPPVSAGPACPAPADRPPGPPPCAPFEDRNGPLLVGRPELDGPAGAAGLGWFGAVELAAVAPHMDFRVSGPVTTGSATGPFVLPWASLGWTVSPRFEVGYRFGQGTGELLAAYRFLLASGTGPAPGLAGGVRSSLDLHVLDLDYASHESSLGPLWDMKWRIGVRLVDLFYETRAAADPTQRATNFFPGVGPHLGLDLRRTLGNGLALFGRLEGASPVGRASQSFSGALLTAADVPPLLRQPGPILSLATQAGVSWCYSDRLGVTAGYTYEHWWDVGFTFTNRAQLTFQGAFLRGEWKY